MGGIQVRVWASLVQHEEYTSIKIPPFVAAPTKPLALGKRRTRYKRGRAGPQQRTHKWTAKATQDLHLCIYTVPY